ncbi:membrane protein insertase YidC [Ornithinibacillus sp. 4-3]|uniref:Membrane protein insertase YidC n=1 Tax=Ornithinibacillus sp. 4-3 TaxID=3231488 RepID=A0AB39HUB7_9BACI
MEKNNILTSFAGKSIILGAILLLFLTGCGGGDFTPIDASTTGFFNQYFVYPFSLLIKGVASFVNDSYGLSIVLITLGLRLVIMPFMVKQQKQGQHSQAVMKIIKPEMEQIQEKYKDKKEVEHQLEMQKELSELYKKHDFNPGKMMLGCLPLIIQMPFLIGFYYAIRRTPEIAEHTFLWFNLGETDYILIAIAVLVYFLQARVSMLGLDEKSRKTMAMMAYFSPIMIGIISFVVPSALTMYWAVGGIFMIIQTLFIKKIILKQI